MHSQSGPFIIIHFFQSQEFCRLHASVRTHDVRDARRFSVHDFGAEFSEPLFDVISILELLKLAVTNDTDTPERERF